MRYLPHTPEEIAAMLAAIGKPTIDALFEQVPPEARLGRPLAIEPPLDEASLMRHLDDLARKNRGAELVSFLGAGAYDHPIPPAVDQLLLRSEFYTSYTPYQPEVAQGTLQAIFEFQTLVSEVFGLPVANASMYEAASAAAEAVLMAQRLTRRERVILSEGVHPHYRQTIETYLQGIGRGKAAITNVAIGEDGQADANVIERLTGPEHAAVVVGYPNFYGGVADVGRIAEIAHRHGALLITVTQEPFALSVLEAPGLLGADIAVGEGQPLGIPLGFGGPYAGLFACRDGRDYLQQVPGRLVGEAVDKNGERGYVLTLATREQHIRRERATSNICTNSGLCALAITIRMCMLGKRGFVEAGRQCLAKAEYLKAQIQRLPGYSLVYPRIPTFNEFAVRVRGGNAAKVVAALEPKGFLAGLDLGRQSEHRRDQLLVATTERLRREDIDGFVKALDSL
jgi:glycine dehydrogenase subunit 1